MRLFKSKRNQSRKLQSHHEANTLQRECESLITSERECECANLSVTSRENNHNTRRSQFVLLGTSPMQNDGGDGRL